MSRLDLTRRREQGKTTQDPTTRSKRAQDVLDDEKAQLGAHKTALHKAQAKLVDASPSSLRNGRRAWRSKPRGSRALRAHFAALGSAERDLVATGFAAG